MTDSTSLIENPSGYDGLKNLQQPDATPPETRISSAAQAQQMVARAVLADWPRDAKRAKVKGLVDGNPPYRQADLEAAGNADRCNVNWRSTESYLNAALTAFYDIFSESPTYATVILDTPNHGDRVDKSRIATEEFDRLQRRESSFDYNMQLSQNDMVLYGSGPMYFPDHVDWRPRAFQHKDLLVPENAKSNTDLWEWCAVRMAYLPHEIYAYIMNEESATQMGWDVEATKQAIMEAHPEYAQGGNYLNWEWVQQQVKNNSYLWAAQSNKVFVSHVYFREFPTEGAVEGKISHVIVVENYGQEKSETGDEDFLFQKIGQFDNWNEVMHPMYYDHGGGGQHHSVTGMGVKMFAAMEYQNRLLCNLADKSFAPKIMFKASTAESEQTLSIANMGEFGLIPSGFDAVQMPVNPLMQDGLLFNRTLTSMLASNLSQYRQDLEQESGNPITATEAQIRSSQQASLGKTQLNRYYEQLDFMYAEKFKRATNPNLSEKLPGGKEAMEFQERCRKRGVTIEDLQKVESVKATRIVGQGSQFLRQQSLEFILGLVQSLPEDGRTHLMQDVIAARAGQSSVARYYPNPASMQKPGEQEERASNQICDMKNGIPAQVNSTQNAVIFCQAYLTAASSALQSIQQGGNPMEVLSFLELCGQAIAAQLQRISNDPTRKLVVRVLGDQFHKIAGLTDQLKQHLQQQAKAKQQQQAQLEQDQQQQNGQLQLQAAKTKADIGMKGAKAQQQMKINQEKHDQQLSIHDATAAAEIRRKNLQSKEKPV